MWLSSNERVGPNAGAATGSGLSAHWGRFALDPDSGTGESKVSGGILFSVALNAGRRLGLSVWGAATPLENVKRNKRLQWSWGSSSGDDAEKQNHSLIKC